MTDETIIPITALELDPRNARKRTPRSSKVIGESLQEFGPLRSLVGQRLPDGRIVVRAGNGTLEEAGQIGIDKVRIVERRPDELVVVVADDLDETQWTRYAIADNRASDLSTWNAEVLEILDQEIDLEPFFLGDELNALMAGLAGDSEGLVESLEPIEGLTDDNAIPDEVETRVKRGDIWQLGRHRVMCGDSTVITDVERLMDRQKADMVFTSPPYSDMRQYEEGTELSIEYLSDIFEWPADYFVVNLGLKFQDCEVVPYWDEWIRQAKDRGFKLLAWNVWDKTMSGSIASATNMFMLTHEWIFVFGERKKALNRIIPNQLEKYAERSGEDFLNGRISRKREFDGSIGISTSSAYTHHQIHSVIQQTPEMGTIRNSHPATFPVGLPEQYILSFLSEKGICGEPFLGSGTTLIACEKTGRTCYGMELSEKYCDVILKRWEDFTGETAVLLK